VEAEQAERAEGLLRGALAAGATRDQVQGWLLTVVCDHFLSLGHALIYVIKAFDFLARVGWAKAPDILPTLLVGIVNSTREDALPTWKHFRSRLAGVQGNFDAWWQRGREATGPAPAGLLEAIVDGGRDDALDAMAAAWEAGAAPRALVDTLSLAAAERLQRFDVAHDAANEVQEGWLDVTHTQTFVHALRHTLDRLDHPSVVRLFFYATRFINHARALDARAAPDVARIHPPADPSDIVDAVLREDSAAATALVAGWLRSDKPVEPLRAAFARLALSDHWVRPIVVAHLIKNGVVAFEEHAALTRAGHPNAAAPVVAYTRLAASPIRQRQVARWCHEAVRFVVDGKVPRTLT
jgi:hypothetical protein